MTDVDDARIRSLVVELVESSPPPPPLPLPRRPVAPTRRPLVLALAALIAVTAPAVLLYAARDEDMSPAARIEASAGAATTRTALVVDEGSTARVHDLDAGTTSLLSLPHRGDGALVVAAGRLVYVGDGSAWAVAVNGATPPLRLGDAVGVAASHDPRRVWLVEPARSDTGGRAHVRQVAVDGTDAGPSVALPRGASRVVAASGTDHLLVGSEGSTQVRAWSHFGEDVHAEFDARHLFALHTNHAALGVDCDRERLCQAVRARHPAYSSADVTTIVRPRGTAGWLAPADDAPNGAFSGDGTLVAMRASGASGDDGRGDVFVTSPYDGPTTKVPDSEAARSSRLAWSPDGRWLFFEEAGSLAAYRPADGRVQRFSIPCCRSPYLAVDRSWLLPSVRPVTDGPVILPSALPDEGVAMERDGGITLFDLAGRDLVRLDGFAFAPDTTDARLLVTDGLRHYLVAPGSSRLDVVMPSDTPDAPSVDGCRVADSRGDDRYLLCPEFRTSAEQEPTIEILGPDGRRRRLAGLAARDGGSWRGVQVSPDGSTLLAQSSGECENPSAFLVPVVNGGLIPIDPGQTGGAQSSYGLGWTKSGDAVVQLVSGGCSSSVVPGVYLVSADGEARLVLASPATPDGIEPGVGLWGHPATP